MYGPGSRQSAHKFSLHWAIEGRKLVSLGAEAVKLVMFHFLKGGFVQMAINVSFGDDLVTQGALVSEGRGLKDCGFTGIMRAFHW